MSLKIILFTNECPYFFHFKDICIPFKFEIHLSENSYNWGKKKKSLIKLQIVQEERD